jgi:predicted nucleotidyltransferase
MSRAKLTRAEREWLDGYRRALTEQHPNSVEQMLIYGSKARGDAGPDSDLDILLIVRNEAGAKKLKLRWIGYLLAAKSDVMPSILAYTSDEWEERKKSGSPFRRAVERDEVRVL